MKQFRDKYKQEAKGTIGKINEILPKLIENQKDSSMRYDIFRYVHSLKGGGAMFGFEALSTLAGKLENAYDKYRENTDTIPNALFEITKEASPFFLELLDLEKVNKDKIKQFQNQLELKIEALGA